MPVSDVPAFTLRQFLDGTEQPHHRAPPGFAPALTEGEARKRMRNILHEFDRAYKQ